MGSIDFISQLISGSLTAHTSTAALESLVVQATPLIGEITLASLVGLVTVILKVALGLGFVIFIHELGHFLAAKTFGVRCDKFYVGFDVPIKIGPFRLPRTLGKFQWGETEYGIGIIPLGGYVKMLGQDDDPRNAQAEADRTRLGDGPAAPLDPRSYPAKPVWQRMIIISAGVVMNLISAVFLAGGAYYLGVPYPPSVVGGVNAGSPAWMAGLQPGDQILQVGGEGTEDPNLRFSDLTNRVVKHGFKHKGQPLELVVDRQGSRRELHPVPSPRYHPDGFYLLGFSGARTTVLNAEPIGKSSFLSQQALDLKSGDRIVAVDGDTLPTDSRFDKVLAVELVKRLQAKWNQPVVLAVERPENTKESIPSQKFEVTLPPVPKHTLGIGFEMGAVTAIRPGSVAEAAGFQTGDKILSIDGQPITDSLRLPQIFATKAGNDVSFVVQRPGPDGASEVDIRLRSPDTPTFDDVSVIGSGELSLGGIGVAFSVGPVVSFVDETLVADGKVQVGDRFLQYRWTPTPAEADEAKKKFNLKYITEVRTIDSFNNVPSLDTLVQDLAVGSAFDCEFHRDGKTISTVLHLHYSPDSFRTDERGLETGSLMQEHRTNQLATAMSLGFRETKLRFFDVLDFLRLMVSGSVGFGGIAGPVKLVDYAAQEASSSTSRLLLFLTMLSANLAILNFLPIPALDGGHMMFLTYEAVRRKPVNEELQVRLTMAGVLGLLTLMAFVILKDIYSYIS